MPYRLQYFFDVSKNKPFRQNNQPLSRFYLGPAGYNDYEMANRFAIYSL